MRKEDSAPSHLCVPDMTEVAREGQEGEVCGEYGEEGYDDEVKGAFE